MIDIYCYLYCVTDVYWEITFKVEIIQSLMWSGCGEWNGHNECSFGHNRGICIPPTMSFPVLKKEIQNKPKREIQNNRGICIPPTMSFLVLKKEMQNKQERNTKLLKSYDQQRITRNACIDEPSSNSTHESYKVLCYVQALKHSRLKIDINPDESLKRFECTDFWAALLSGDMQCRFHYNLNFWSAPHIFNHCTMCIL